MYVEYDYIRRNLATYLTLESCKMPASASEAGDDWMDFDEEIEQERPSKDYKAVISGVVDSAKDIFAHDYKIPEAAAMSNQAHRAAEYDTIIDLLRRHAICLYPQKEGWAEFDFSKVAQVIGADGLAALVQAIYDYGGRKYQEGWTDCKNKEK